MMKTIKAKAIYVNKVKATWKCDDCKAWNVSIGDDNLLKEFGHIVCICSDCNVKSKIEI